MGRYRSEQYFPDTATAKVKIDGLFDAGKGYNSTGTAIRSDGAAHVGAPTQIQGIKVIPSIAPPAPEKVERQVGSTAGASSSEFHIYRASRRREITRIEMQEKEAAELQQAQEYANRVEMNRTQAEVRTKKNAEKRKKRKNSGKHNPSLKLPRHETSESVLVSAYLSSGSDAEDVAADDDVMATIQTTINRNI